MREDLRIESALQSPDPVLVADLFPELLDTLIELLASLSAAEWGKPTACSGWSVRDVALHLLGGEIGNLSRRRDGYLRESSILGWDELVTAINDWNQGWVQATQHVSPPLLIDLLAFTGAQMNGYFRSLDPFALGSSVSWVGPEPAPVWLDIAREYTERWHHQQHIRDAVGKPGLKEPRYFKPVLAAFVRAMPQAYSGVPAPEGTLVVLAISGESGGGWSLLRKPEGWHLYQGALEQSTAQVIVNQDFAWRAWTRGLSQDEARRHMIFKGERELCTPVLNMVSIIA
jgi:uncharacterized protein (TIGR03083 family)